MKNCGKLISKYGLLGLLMLTALGVNECSQDTNMSLRYVRNFVGAPFIALERAISGQTSGAIESRYDKYLLDLKEEEMQKEAYSENLRTTEDGKIVDCNRPPQNQAIETFARMRVELMNGHCACSPWQNASTTCQPKCCSFICPKENRCHLTCPNGLSILKHNKERAAPTAENTLAFQNSGFDVFKNEVREIPKTQLEDGIPSAAYNFGMISARRKFNELAFFGQGTEPAFPAGDTGKDERLSWYKEKIDAIFEGGPADFPGYKNLREFSADPAFQTYIKQKVAEEWVDKSIGVDLGERTVERKKVMDKKRADKLLANLTEKIKNLGSATVSFGYSPGRDDDEIAQGLEAYKMFKDTDGNNIICVHDPNMPAAPYEKQGVGMPSPQVPYLPGPPESCGPYLMVDAAGKTTYQTLKRNLLSPPKMIKDEAGIEMPVRYEDVQENRELYDVSVFDDSDERDAVLEIPPMHQKCREKTGC